VFVGTKRQIRTILAREAKRCDMPFVNERWLGGTLTNFATVRARLARLHELEDLESSGRMQEMPKKAQSFLTRELRRIRRNLDGIRDMSELPGALLVVDARKEYIAVNEANRLGIPIVAILDTDSDPTSVDIPIPGNDDAMRSVETLLLPLVEAILAGKSRAAQRAEEERKAQERAAAAAAEEKAAREARAAEARAKAEQDAQKAEGGDAENPPKAPSEGGSPESTPRTQPAAGGE
jgi:small subunit ribosomal protein S2